MIYPHLKLFVRLKSRIFAFIFGFEFQCVNSRTFSSFIPNQVSGKSIEIRDTAS